jgi:hypothetical protein
MSADRCFFAGNYPQAGNADAALKLAGLLAGRGDLDTVTQMLLTLAKRGDRATVIHVFRAWAADARGRRIAERLVQLLEERDDLGGMQIRADLVDWHAAERQA